MTRKQINRKLRELSSKIPPEITKIQQFTGEYDEEKQPIMSEYEVWTNHYRRIKRLFYRTGGSMDELQAYFNRYGITLSDKLIGEGIPMETMYELAQQFKPEENESKSYI